MSARSDAGQLRKVGVMWRPKEGARSLGSGSLTINGLRQRFVIFENRFKERSNDPDFVLMSSDEPEPDRYAARHADGEERRSDDDSDRRASGRGERRRTPW